MTSPRGKDKKPTLFSTFTQHDLALRKEATEVAKSQSAQVSDNGSEEERPSWIFRVVNHHWFDAFFSVVVITNSIFIGIDVELNPSAMGSRSSVIVVIQYIYTLLFCIELVSVPQPWAETTTVPRSGCGPRLTCSSSPPLCGKSS